MKICGWSRRGWLGPQRKFKVGLEFHSFNFLTKSWPIYLVFAHNIKKVHIYDKMIIFCFITLATSCLGCSSWPLSASVTSWSISSRTRLRSRKGPEKKLPKWINLQAATIVYRKVLVGAEYYNISLIGLKEPRQDNYVAATPTQSWKEAGLSSATYGLARVNYKSSWIWTRSSFCSHRNTKLFLYSKTPIIP